MNKSVSESSLLQQGGSGLLTEEFIYCCYARILSSIIKTYRLYKQAGLSIKQRNKKKKYEQRSMLKKDNFIANTRWSMNFVLVKTSYNNNIRILTVIDETTSECIALEVDSSLTGKHVCAVLIKKQLFRGLSKEILTDNGSEFISNALSGW